MSPYALQRLKWFSPKAQWEYEGSFISREHAVFWQQVDEYKYGIPTKVVKTG